jgi:hypothetical protein
MSVILQPEHGPPSTRLEYWDHVLRESICPLEFRVADGLSVPDRLRFRAFGPIQVAEVLASGPSQADRTLKHVRASDPDLCKIDVFLTGETFVEQDGRQARLCGATSPSSIALDRRGGPRRPHTAWRCFFRARCCR